MGTELTHDQAEVLRIADSTAHPLHPHCYSATYELAMDGRRLAGLIEHWCVGYGLTEAGREALAAYDAEFVTVRRDDLAMAVGQVSGLYGFYQWVEQEPPSKGGGETPCDSPPVPADAHALLRLRAALESK